MQFWTPSGKARILNGFGLLYKPRHAPGFGSRYRPALRDLYQVALAEFARVHVGVVFARARQRFTHHGVPYAALDTDHDGFLHLVAGDPADKLSLVLRRDGRSLLCRCTHLAAFSFMSVCTRAMSRRTFFIWLVLDSCCVATCMRRPNCALRSPSSSFCSSSPFFPRSSLAFMAYPSIRCTTMVRNGSLAAASAKASFARASVTPSISNRTLPGWISATKYSGLPLPLPMRTSAGLVEIGLSGNTRIQIRPPRLIWRDMARRAASSWRAVSRPRVVAFSPCSPKETLLPRVAMPVLRPFCCLRYLVLAG